MIRQGDPLKTISKSGSTINITNGYTERDPGITNAILYSLFSRDWALNSFMGSKTRQLGSDYEIEAEKSITADQLLVVRSAAEKALEWMVQTNIASEVEVKTSVNEDSQLVTEIKVHRMDGSLVSFSLARFSDAWDMQVAYG